MFSVSSVFRPFLSSRPHTSAGVISDGRWSAGPKVSTARRPGTSASPRVVDFCDWGSFSAMATVTSSTDSHPNSATAAGRRSGNRDSKKPNNSGTGRMFLRMKSSTTKGERDLMLGICENRGLKLDKTKNPVVELIDKQQVLSHKELWTLGKYPCVLKGKPVHKSKGKVIKQRSFPLNSEKEEDMFQCDDCEFMSPLDYCSNCRTKSYAKHLEDKSNGLSIAPPTTPEPQIADTGLPEEETGETTDETTQELESHSTDSSESISKNRSTNPRTEILIPGRQDPLPNFKGKTRAMMDVYLPHNSVDCDDFDQSGSDLETPEPGWENIDILVVRDGGKSGKSYRSRTGSTKSTRSNSFPQDSHFDLGVSRKRFSRNSPETQKETNNPLVKLDNLPVMPPILVHKVGEAPTLYAYETKKPKPMKSMKDFHNHDKNGTCKVCVMLRKMDIKTSFTEAY